jgi:hypothetical protein
MSRAPRLPARYREFIEPFIALARGHVEAGHGLAPLAFVASFASNSGVPVQIDTRDDAGKESSARAIRQAAARLDADCVFTILEAWGLPRELAPRYDEFVGRYGSITDCPFRVDAVNFILETREGVWAGQVPIEPQRDGNRRTFGEVVLEHVDAGGYAKLLPERHGDPSGGAPLH